MNSQFIQKLQYSYLGQKEAHQLPVPLTDSLHLISSFFSESTNNKLALVFPSKEYAAQWLSIPVVMSLIKDDFNRFKEEILESYKQYKQGEKLILNSKAIVEWVGIKKEGVAFITKGFNQSSGVEITIRLSEVIMLQKAPSSRQALSSIKVVKGALPSASRIITPIEKLLDISTYGNKEFIKNSICLISKFKAYDKSIEGMSLNNACLPEYFKASKIDDNGQIDENNPLLISNNLSNLFLFLTQSKTISKIIIDGYSAINERITDFSEIDILRIPTILITDLSEIEFFESIANFGFEFFNFSKENLKYIYDYNNSPFRSFNKKICNYRSFNLVREICQNAELEVTTQKINSIEKDESNNDLNILKFSLIQLTNLLSRIVHIPTTAEIASFNFKLNKINDLFLSRRMWLGDSHKPIEESISLLKSVIDKYASTPSEKCVRLKMLMTERHYDYIICPTEEEAKGLNDSLNQSGYSHKPKVISIADVNDNALSPRLSKAILTGWAKSNNINKILFSFFFSELTVLFFQFENKYYNSLQRRNRKFNEDIKTTINSNGSCCKSDSVNSRGFCDLFSGDESVIAIADESSFNILDFELKLENIQHSKYAAKGDSIESIKAKRVDFENAFFYSAESRKFLVITGLLEKQAAKANLYMSKIETLKAGDVIALINTDRDILVELVEKNTDSSEFASVKQWTELWKNLLKEYYASVGHDFKKTVAALRENDCKKRDTTIRAWLQDESRIGPEDDADLINIAVLTKSTLLYDNIKTVRDAIRQMTGWRIKAADYIIGKIKSQLHEFADSSIINKKIEVDGLGSVIVLKVIEVSNVWVNIDIKYVNRLLQKEII